MQSLLLVFVFSEISRQCHDFIFKHFWGWFCFCSLVVNIPVITGLINQAIIEVQLFLCHVVQIFFSKEASSLAFPASCSHRAGGLFWFLWNHHLVPAMEAKGFQSYLSGNLWGCHLCRTGWMMWCWAKDSRWSLTKQASVQSTDRPQHRLDAWRPPKTKENWIACCSSRGPMIQKTGANTAWQPLPWEEGTFIQNSCFSRSCSRTGFCLHQLAVLMEPGIL